MTRRDGGNDTDLDAVLDGDPVLTELAARAAAGRPDARLDPRFQATLRAQLMREAPAILAAPQERAPGPLARWWRRPALPAFGGAALGTALVAAAIVALLTTRISDHRVVTAVSPVAARHAVSPDNAITISFSQPMDQRAVVAGLHIQPATAYTTSWQGTSLVITPTHHLAGNTPYTLTIDRRAARAASGQTAPADILITFGTAPTPPPPTAVQTLTGTPVGPTGLAGPVLVAPDGTVVVTKSVAGPTGSPSPAPESPSPVTSPSASGTPSPSSSPAASSIGDRVLVSVTPSGKVTTLGPAPAAAALSPDGLMVLSATPAGNSTTVALSRLDGTHRTTLATLSGTVVGAGWSSSTVALVAQPDRIRAVDIAGQVTQRAALPAGTTGATFAPGGAYVYAVNQGGDGSLIDVATGAARRLQGSRSTVAFSGAGDSIAWVDVSGTVPQLLVSPVNRAATTTIPLRDPGSAVGGLALNGDGTRVAYTEGDPGQRVVVAAVPAGTTLALGPPGASPAFTATGDGIEWVAGGELVKAPLGAAAGAGSPPGLPDGAGTAVVAFIDAQVSGDRNALSGLSAAGVNAAASTPSGLSRGYLVSAEAASDGVVHARARLVVDPSPDRPVATFVDETLTLAPSGGHAGYLVTALVVAPQVQEPLGPHVVRVVPATVGGSRAVLVVFDSDLRADTVAGSLGITTPAGRAISASVSYDPETRTASITPSGVCARCPLELQVTVATSMLDIEGHALSAAFSATISL